MTDNERNVESDAGIEPSRPTPGGSIDASVTRRDFIGGSLIGSGAALLGMASPAAMRTAQAQTTGLPMTGLGPEWTGPGGIGDYANANGNTWDVVNASHGLVRNGDLDRRLASARDTGEKFDVIVVGCGIAGLTAAWTVQKEKPNARILLLDQYPIFGGEAKQNELEVDGVHLTAPQGSTGIMAPSAVSKRIGWFSDIGRQLGWPDEFVFQQPTGLSKDILVPHDAWTPMHLNWDQSDTGHYFEGKGWVKNPWRNGFRDAPIPESSKLALMALELHRNPPVRDDWAPWLDSMTYQEFLVNVMGITGRALEDVTRELNHVMAAYGCGLGADVISAYSAYNFNMPGVNGYLRYEFGGAMPPEEMYLASFPGGNAGTARMIVKKILPEAFDGEYDLGTILTAPLRRDQLDRSSSNLRMRLSSTVLSVTHVGRSGASGSASVVYLRDGKLEKAHAKAVICAGQQHVNRHICRDVTDDYREAMNSFHHAPMLTVNVAMRNWKFLENLGIASARWYEGFGWWMSLRRNLEIPGQKTMPLDPSKPFVFSLYNSFPMPGLPFAEQCTAARMSVFGMTFAHIEQNVRAQMTKLFGDHGFDAERDIAGVIANRWGHAYVVDPPGFFFPRNGKTEPRGVLRQRFDRLSFAHSELSGMQTWENACNEGERAGRQALELV